VQALGDTDQQLTKSSQGNSEKKKKKTKSLK